MNVQGFRFQVSGGVLAVALVFSFQFSVFSAGPTYLGKFSGDGSSLTNLAITTNGLASTGSVAAVSAALTTASNALAAANAATSNALATVPDWDRVIVTGAGLAEANGTYTWTTNNIYLVGRTVFQKSDTSFILLTTNHWLWGGPGWDLHTANVARYSTQGLTPANTNWIVLLDGTAPAPAVTFFPLVLANTMTNQDSMLSRGAASAMLQSTQAVLNAAIDAVASNLTILQTNAVLNGDGTSLSNLNLGGGPLLMSGASLSGNDALWMANDGGGFASIYDGLGPVATFGGGYFGTTLRPYVISEGYVSVATLGENTFTGTNTFSDVLTAPSLRWGSKTVKITDADDPERIATWDDLSDGGWAGTNTPVVFSTVSASNYFGSGAGLSNVPASTLTGTLPLAALPATVLTNLAGDSSGLSNIPAAKLTGSIAPVGGSTFTAFAGTNKLVFGGVGTNSVIPGGKGSMTFLPNTLQAGDVVQVFLGSYMDCGTSYTTETNNFRLVINGASFPPNGLNVNISQFSAAGKFVSATFADPFTIAVLGDGTATLNYNGFFYRVDSNVHAQRLGFMTNISFSLSATNTIDLWMGQRLTNSTTTVHQCLMRVTRAP